MNFFYNKLMNHKSSTIVKNFRDEQSPWRKLMTFVPYFNES